MSAAALRAVLLAVLLAVWPAGCGTDTKSTRTPDLAGLPLVAGSQIVTKVKDCDIGSNPYCAWLLVVVNRHYATSRQFSQAEHLLLKSRGWSRADADTGEERGADSPGHRLRVTFSAAAGDLKGIDLGWISRPRPIALALSRTLFERMSAISVMLEVGNG